MAVFDNIKGISVASGFKLQAESALDPRLVVATLTERDELVTSNGAYEGMTVYVKSNKKTYQLQGTTVDKWVDTTSEASIITNKLNSITVTNGLNDTGTTTDPVIEVVIDPNVNNILTKSEDGLLADKSKCAVTVDTTNTSTDYSAVYTFKQFDETIATVNIPKDMVVSSGVVETYTAANAPTDPSKTDGSKLAAGTYIVLTIANKAKDKLYIPVDDLIEYVTAGTPGADDGVQISISDDHKVTAKLLDNSVTAAKIVNNAVTEAKINDSAVTTDKVADSAVTEAKIANNAVTTDKVNNSAITTAKINDSAVTTDKINNSAVTTAKINNSAVTTDKVADSAITEAKINNAAVTTDKIADNAITEAKLSSDITDKLDLVVDGTTSVKGIVKLSNATDSTDETTAATPKAVNDVKKIAESKVSVVWVGENETVPTTAEANTLCFKILGTAPDRESNA